MSIVSIQGASRKKKVCLQRSSQFFKKKIHKHYISIIAANLFYMYMIFKMADRVMYDKMLEGDMFPHLLALMIIRLDTKI